MAQWVKRVVQVLNARSGESDGGQSALAAILTERLRRNIDRSMVYKMIRDERKVKADEAPIIEEISGIPSPVNQNNIAVRIIDWVTAGKLAAPDSQIPPEDWPIIYVDRRLVGNGDFFALKVAGDSMNLVSPHGSTIVVNRKERDPIHGSDYVVRVEGETTYKRYFRDKPERFEPHSTNHKNKTILVDKKKGFEVIGRAKRTIIEQ